MTDNKVNTMCDKAISIIKKYGQSNYISNEKCNDLVSEIQALKSKQDRSLASEINERHENYMKDYVGSMKSIPDYSQDFVNLQSECIFILNEVEESLYLRDKLKI